MCIRDRVSTNVPDIVSEDRMDEIVEDFMKVMRPTEIIRRVITFIRDRMRIQEGGYISIHARCGDAHLDGARLNPMDNRALPADVIPQVLEAVAAVRDGKCADPSLKGLPVVLHTDSMEVRTALTGRVRVFGGKIQHTGEEGEAQGFLDAIAEFYIMAGAKEIFYITPSGFSRFAALFRGIYAKSLDTLFAEDAEEEPLVDDVEVEAVEEEPLVEVEAVEEEPLVEVEAVEEEPLVEVEAVEEEPLVEVEAVEATSVEATSVEATSVEAVAPIAATPAISLNSKKNKKRKNNT
jgi:hypothetical protein